MAHNWNTRPAFNGPATWGRRYTHAGLACCLRPVKRSDCLRLTVHQVFGCASALAAPKTYVNVQYVRSIMYCSRHMYDGLPQSASPCLALPHLDQSKYTVRIYVQYVCTFTAAHTGRHTCRITGTCAGHGLASQVVRGSTKRSCRTECKGGKAVWRHVTRYQICVRPGTTAGGTCRG